MKKKLIPILALVGLGALGSCGPTGGKTIDIFIYEFSDTYIGSVRTALDKNLKDLGYTSGVMFRDAASNAANQIQSVRNVVSTGTDVILANLVDQTGTCATVADLAKDADIPVIYFNREVTDAVVDPANYNACFVGTDPDEAGYMQGQIIADTLVNAEGELDPKWDKNGDGKINYVMFRAEPGNPEADGRTKYSVENANALLAEKGLGDAVLTRLGEDNMASWSADKAKTMMDTAIGTYGLDASTDDVIEMVIANNDDMAIGAIQSLKANGWNAGKDEDGNIDYTKTALVVGVDATASGRAAIDKGEMAGTVVQDAEGMAKCLATLTDNVLNGKGFIEGTDYKWDSASVQKIRIPYASYTGE